MKFSKIIIIIGFSFLMMYRALFASGQGEGYDIMKKADLNNRGYQSEGYISSLYLIDADQDTVIRKFIGLNLERNNSANYSIIEYLDPPDVRGTKFLTYHSSKGNSEEWMYTPEFKRVKKIKQNLTGAFMTSEFSHEDIYGNIFENYSYKKTGDETLEGVPCYLIEKYPKGKRSEYSMIKVWISKDKYLPQRMEFSDRNQTLLKVESFSEWKKVDARAWRPEMILMYNMQSNRVSELKTEKINVGIGLSEADFNSQRLEREIRF